MHDRDVIQLEDFLGAIAGLYDLLMYAIFFVFGSYIDFVARVKWIKARYRFLSVEHDEDEKGVYKRKVSILKLLNLAPTDGKLDLTKLNLTQFYLRNESNIRFFLCCIKRSDKELQEKRLIEKGSDQLE